MKDIEEQLLHQNAGEVKQQTEAMPEMRVVQAMRTGIRKGKTRSRRRYLISGAGIVMAAAAILLIFTFLYPAEPNDSRTSRASSETSGWNDSARFKDLLAKNNNLANAFNQNLIEPVYRSEQKAGLRVEIMGTVSDGRQVFILYSVQNNTAQTVNHSGFSLSFGKIKAASLGARLQVVGGDSRIGAGQTVYFIYSNNLSTETAYPEDAKFNAILSQTSKEAMLSSSNKYRISIDITFKLDTKQLSNQSRSWVTRQDMTIAGQKLKIKQILLTPLNIYADIEADEKNSKQVFGLINPVLIGETEDGTSKSYYSVLLNADNSELYSDRNHFSLVYPWKNYIPEEPISLKVFGIAALDKNQMKVVIDLNKKQLIEAPLGLSLDNTQKTKGAGKVVLNFRMKNEYAQDSATMRLENGFTDAEGNRHSLSDGESNALSEFLSRGSKSVDEKYFYNFGEKASTYPQPLTIAIERYWIPVMETQEMELSPE